MTPVWWRSPQFWARVGRFATALLICLAVLRFWWWAGTPVWLWAIAALLACVLLTKVAMFEGSWRGYFKVKFREWSTDIRQLWLWARLAFKPKRDDQDVAAMAHQARFLDGRTLSPVNIFTYLPLILGVLGVFTIGIDQWRIDRVKKERDAPCSNRELSQNGQGEFRTSRASCAALGETNDVLRDYVAALELERAERDGEVERVRAENASTIQRLQADAQRRQALAARQRRRENEGIEAALGGDAPDLERSLCELAGNVDCAPADGAGNGALPPATDIVSDAPARTDGQ